MSDEEEIPADWWVGMPEEARKQAWKSSPSNPAAPRMICWITTNGYNYCPFMTQAPLESREARQEMRDHFDIAHPGRLQPTDLVEPTPGDNIPTHVYDPVAREGWDANPTSLLACPEDQCVRPAGHDRPHKPLLPDTDPTGLSPWTKETPGIVETDLGTIGVDLTVDPSPIEVDLTIDPVSFPTGAIPRSWIRTEDLLPNPGGWRGWLMKRLSR